MASNKNIASGRHLTAMALTLQTVSTAGALADGTAYTLVSRAADPIVGWVEEVEFDMEQEIEDGTVIGSPVANDIPVVSRAMCTITEPLRYASAGTRNLLATAYFNAVSNGDGTTGTPYVKIAITRGAQSFAFTGVMRNYRETYRKGKLVGVMTISIADTGASNPTYA